MSGGSTVSAGSASASPAGVGKRVPGKQRAGRSGRAGRRTEPIRTPAASRPNGDDREHLLDRLQDLRTIVPVFAHELASTRRETAALRLENSRLFERIRELQRKHARPR
jgi:hypothetical protein